MTPTDRDSGGPRDIEMPLSSVTSNLQTSRHGIPIVSTPVTNNRPIDVNNVPKSTILALSPITSSVTTAPASSEAFKHIRPQPSEEPSLPQAVSPPHPPLTDAQTHHHNTLPEDDPEKLREMGEFVSTGSALLSKGNIKLDACQGHGDPSRF